jgi:hypothetical protein
VSLLLVIYIIDHRLIAFPPMLELIIDTLKYNRSLKLTHCISLKTLLSTAALESSYVTVLQAYCTTCLCKNWSYFLKNKLNMSPKLLGIASEADVPLNLLVKHKLIHSWVCRLY